MWSTDQSMFRSFLLTGGITNQQDKYKLVQAHDFIFDRISTAAYQLGIIRLIVETNVNYTNTLYIKVNQETDEIPSHPKNGKPSPYNYYDAEKMTIDIPRLIDEYLCVTDRQKSVKYDIVMKNGMCD